MSLKDAVSGMEQSVDSLIKKLTSAQRTLGGRSGMAGTGSNFLDNALGGFSQDPGTRAMARMGMGGTIARGTGNVVSGASSMMPNVSATMDRMTSFYGSTIRAGQGMSRNQVQQMTLGTLQGGLTSVGADAMVAGQLTMRGMVAEAGFNSTYQETLRGVRGAAQYLNMSNERAATAIERMTAGPQSAQMLRNFGISTADPRTGKEKTQGQIFSELYGRLTAGRGTASERQVMESYRRGALGATLRASGMSQDQQQMFVQYAVERARGNNMDLSDPEAMEELMNKAKAEGNENPNLPGYTMNTAGTNAMQSAQEAYLAGIKAVTPVLRELVEVGGDLAGVFGGLKSAAGMIGGTPAAGGAASMIGGFGQAVGGMAGLALMSGRTGKGGIGQAASALVGRVGGSTKGAMGATSKAKPRGMGVKGFGVAGLAAVGGSMVGEAVSGGAESGSFQDRAGGFIGGAASGAAIGATIGSFIPVPGGTLIGGAIGGVAGGLMGAFGEGGGSESGEADDGQSQKKSPRQLKLMHPTKSAKITAEYGRRESAFTPGKITWPDGHKGVDYAGKKGDNIYASADGYATLHDGGQLGKRVRIKHESGHTTHYCHLSAITVSEGPVKKGTVIGKMGNTGGKSTGVHLHFALSSGPTTATHMDPKPYMEGGGTYGGGANGSGTEQSPQSNDVTSAGSLSASSNPGGEDSTAPSPTSATNNTPAGTSKNVSNPGGISSAGGSSAAADLESWSAGSVWYGGGGANTAAAPEGGENSSDQPGYLSTASTERAVGRNKRSAESKNVTNNVSINLSLERGTSEEARRFAQMLKKALEDEEAMKRMARN